LVAEDTALAATFLAGLLFAGVPEKVALAGSALETDWAGKSNVINTAPLD